MSDSTTAIDNGVPAKLANKGLPVDKLFYLLTALEAEGALKGSVFKLVATLSEGKITSGALEFALREWRKEAKDLIASKGENLGEAVKKPVKANGGTKAANGAKKRKSDGE